MYSNFILNNKEKRKNIKEFNFEISLDQRIELGIYIKKLRENKKLTFKQLSDLTKVGVSDLHKIEHGTKIRINPFQLKVIGIALNTDYKIFYKIAGFLDEIDFIDKKVDSTVKYILDSLENLSEEQIKDIILFIDFTKNKK